MKEIIVRAVVVAVVSVVIGSMTKGVEEEKKAVKEVKTYSSGEFAIKYDKLIQIIMIVGFLLFVFMHHSVYSLSLGTCVWRK